MSADTKRRLEIREQAQRIAELEAEIARLIVLNNEQHATIARFQEVFAVCRTAAEDVEAAWSYGELGDVDRAIKALTQERHALHPDTGND